jgi:phage-related protein
MTSGSSRDDREVVFINAAALAEYDALPPFVREAVDASLTVLQNGGVLPASRHDRLKGKLAGVSEIKVRFDDDTYRTYYVSEFREVIYVLDAGIKKSPTGGRIPQKQAERLERRLAAARDDYERNESDYRRAYEERARTREAQFSSGPRRH